MALSQVALTTALQKRRAARLERVWAAMEAEGYPALVVAGRGIISQYGYLEYVSGYCPVIRHAYAVVTPGAEPALILPTAADAWYARRATGLEDIRVAGQGDVVAEYDHLPAAVARALDERGAAAATIGFVGLRHIVSMGEYKLLRAELRSAELVDATALLAAIKAVKDDEDVRQLALTAAIADHGLEVCLARLRDGATGWEVGAAMEEAVRARGAREVLIFLSADPYFLARPDERPLRRGDLVTAYVEITGPSGYWVEVARLVALGPLDAERRALAQACLESARAAEARLRVGRTAADVARAIDERAAAEGFNVGIWHGHGVGIDHDPPVITAGDATPLAERMAISIHPNFSTGNERLGVSVADTYIVRAGPPQRLSRLAPELHRL